MSINLLPEEIVNQIAAGEVIENPSAVIKELVENSIDAGAYNIEVEIENSGIKRIAVKDNGSGIEKDDLLKAPLRHATSKIKSFSDLYNIKTMGFRGEALASIFSVAKSKIISKRADSDIAWEITSENKDEVKESACQNGTCIHIEDLFYNTPARRKYLRSDNMELKAILDVINRFEVYYHNIKFNLKHNGKILINKPAFKTPEDNIYYVLGKELRDNLLYFEKEMDGLKVSGFLGKPSNITYPFRKNQHMYVNSRYVKSKLVRDAIYEGFGTNLMEGRHPFFVAFIDIDPEIIDVNVHPTKIEIRFENELEIYEFMRNAVKEVFEKNETFKPFEKRVESRDERLEKHIDLGVSDSDIRKERGEEKTYFSKETQKPLEVAESESELSKVLIDSSENSYDFQDDMIDDKSNIDNSPISNQAADSESLSFGPLYETLKDYRIVGQINKTFIILETPKEMIVVDQHVAEEKFFFETFKEQVENSSVKSQNLLKPEMISFTNQEMLLYKDNLDLIEKLGFKTEEFGSNEIVVRAVPIGIQGEIVNAQTLKDIIHEITVDKKFKSLEEEKLEKLASMSCKRSIKAGHEMTIPEIHRMIENLKRLKEPFNCPHGRPILLNWSFTDLEKKFKRIV